MAAYGIRDSDGEYRYVRIDNSALSLEETVDLIQSAIPEIYRQG